MNKELTPLEALKEVKEYNFGGVKDFNKHFVIIETALKDYEKLTNEDIEKPAYITYEEIQKLEAFYILKSTGLDIDWFVSSFIKKDADYNVFLMLLEEMGNEGHLAKQLMMSEAEFDLLKEVLK